MIVQAARTNPANDTNDLAIMRLVSTGQLPRFDATTSRGEPAWRMSSITAWLGVSIDQLLDVIPPREEGERQQDDAGGYPVHQ